MYQIPSKIRSSVLMIPLLFLAGTALSKPINLTIIGDESQVSFIAKTKPVPLTIEGTGKGLTGKLKILDATHTEGDVSFPLKNLSTKLEKRDEHMQKTLDTERFPIAKFTATVLPWSDPSQILIKAVEAQPFEGKMTLHGVEKTIKGNVTTKLPANGKVEFDFKFEINIVDFGMTAPGYLGVSVKEIVEVNINAATNSEAL